MAEPTPPLWDALEAAGNTEDDLARLEALQEAIYSPLIIDVEPLRRLLRYVGGLESTIPPGLGDLREQEYGTLCDALRAPSSWGS